MLHKRRRAGNSLLWSRTGADDRVKLTNIHARCRQSLVSSSSPHPKSGLVGYISPLTHTGGTLDPLGRNTQLLAQLRIGYASLGKIPAKTSYLHGKHRPLLILLSPCS